MPTDVLSFVANLELSYIPTATQDTLKRSVLDIIGVVVVGCKTAMGQITADYAADHWDAGFNGPKARLLFYGA
jgi:2-methylcitrate dehydratase PrpD